MQRNEQILKDYFETKLNEIKNSNEYASLTNTEKQNLENSLRKVVEVKAEYSNNHPVCNASQEEINYAKQLLNRGGSNNIKTQQQPVHIDAAYREQLYAAMTPEQREQAERQEAIAYVANLMNNGRR